MNPYNSFCFYVGDTHLCMINAGTDLNCCINQANGSVPHRLHSCVCSSGYKKQKVLSASHCASRTGNNFERIFHCKTTYLEGTTRHSVKRVNHFRTEQDEAVSSNLLADFGSGEALQ